MMWSILYIAIAAGVFGADVCLKNHVERVRFPGRFHNRGAVLGLWKKHGHFVTFASVLLTLALLVLFVASLGKAGNRWLRTGLSFLLGGAFSNTYDRLKRKYVVDYIPIDMLGKRQKKLVFNIADFCIIIGALLSAIGGMQ